MTCADIEPLEWIYKELINTFKEVTIKKGPKLNYLGMLVNQNPDWSIDISMPKLVDQITQDIETIASTPANMNIFDTSGIQTRLSKAASEHFHSLIGKLLYLTIWVRPDLSPAVPALARYVICPTVSHVQKLDRIRSFLKRTAKIRFRISTDPIGEIRAFIDVSFAVHPDLRSHSGLVVVAGNTPLLCKSKRQKIITVNSAESEIVAITNMIPHTSSIWSYLAS